MPKENNGHTAKDLQRLFNSEKFDVVRYRAVIRKGDELFEIEGVSIDDANQRVYLDLGDEVE